MTSPCVCKKYVHTLRDKLFFPNYIKVSKGFLFCIAVITRGYKRACPLTGFERLKLELKQTLSL